MKQHTDKQIQIMRLALSMSGLPANDAGAETVLLVVEHMERLGGKFSLREACNIEYFISKKYNQYKITVEGKKKK